MYNVQCGHFSEKGSSSDADIALFLDFLKFMMCPYGQWEED